MTYGTLESILIVHQNATPGLEAEFDDWYSNVHIRDAMRCRGGIGAQRFRASADQLPEAGGASTSLYAVHTLYEWESAADCVEDHAIRAGGPEMRITADGSYDRLRVFFYHPEYLSDGFSRESGYRRGDDVLTAMINLPEGLDENDFTGWFTDRHAPHTLALPGIASIGLFRLHDEQMLPYPAEHRWTAVYALSDRKAAVKAWTARRESGSDLDLAVKAPGVEYGVWQPITPRLRAEEVSPDRMAAPEERRARIAAEPRFLTPERVNQSIGNPADA
jgi:hypothetical protein